MTFYVLDADGRPLGIEDVLVWARWFEDHDRRVAMDMVGDVRVSTVFLGIDHNWLLGGPPVLWETMIFGGPHDGEMWRYASREAAEAGHAATVEAERVAAAGQTVTTTEG